MESVKFPCAYLQSMTVISVFSIPLKRKENGYEYTVIFINLDNHHSYIRPLKHGMDFTRFLHANLKANTPKFQYLQHAIKRGEETALSIHPSAYFPLRASVIYLFATCYGSLCMHWPTFMNPGIMPNRTRGHTGLIT